MPVYCVLFKSFTGSWVLDRIYASKEQAEKFIADDSVVCGTGVHRYKIELRKVLD